MATDLVIEVENEPGALACRRGHQRCRGEPAAATYTGGSDHTELHIPCRTPNRSGTPWPSRTRRSR